MPFLLVSTLFLFSPSANADFRIPGGAPRLEDTSPLPSARQEPVKLPLDLNTYQPQTSPDSRPNSYSLFSNTCNNIAYNGVIENQVIAVLNDTKNFIEQLTDPVVNITQFEAGLFIYGFAICLRTSVEDIFSDKNCDGDLSISDSSAGRAPSSVGNQCLTTRLVDAISNVKDIATVVGGVQGSIASVGTTINTSIDTAKSKQVIGGTLDNAIKSGWFDHMMVCVQDEKKKILKFLSELFNRNFKIKSSIITSINLACNVPLLKKGDPTTWKEIVKLQRELNNGTKAELDYNLEKGETDYATYEYDLAKLSEKNSEKSFINDIAENSDDTSKLLGRAVLRPAPCVDGYTKGNELCLTERQKRIQEVLSTKIKTEKMSSILSCKKLTSMAQTLFETPESSVLRDKYLPAAQSIAGQTIAALVPQSCAASPNSITDAAKETVLLNYKYTFNNLKNIFRIKPKTKIAKEIDSIFYSVFREFVSVKLPSPTAGGKALSIKPVLLPLENPFDSRMLLWGPPRTEKYTIAKVSGASSSHPTANGLSVAPIYSEQETQTIKKFYKSYIQSVIYNKDDEYFNNNNGDKETQLRIFLNTQLVTADILSAAKSGLEATVAGQYFEDFLGTNNSLTTAAAALYSANELDLFKQHALKLQIIKMFKSTQGPLDLATLSFSPIDFEYAILSAVKDYTIPRNFNIDTRYKRIRKFFQSLIIAMKTSDIQRSIGTLATKIEDWNNSPHTDPIKPPPTTEPTEPEPDTTTTTPEPEPAEAKEVYAKNALDDRQTAINTLTQKGNFSHERQKAKNAALFNFRE